MKFLRAFLGLLVALALVLSYAVYRWWSAERQDSGTDAGAPVRWLSLSEQALHSLKRGRPADPLPPAPEGTLRRGRAEGRSFRVARPPPNPAGDLVWTGERVAHPRAGLGYSRLAVARWQAGGRTGPSPERVGLSLSPFPTPTPVAPPAGEALPAPGSSAGDALQTGAAGAGEVPPGGAITEGAREPPAAVAPEPKGGKIIERKQPLYPYVEVFDRRGEAHRLQLDNNRHLVYSSPEKNEIVIDGVHRVTAFNLNLDLADQVHVAWFQPDTNQLSYAWLARDAQGKLGVYYSAMIDKPPEPDFIEIRPLPDRIRIRYGTEEEQHTLSVDTGDPSVHVRVR